VTRLNPHDFRDARLLAGVTLAEAGEAIGTGDTFVAHVEAGRRHFSPEQAEKLREYLASKLRRRAEQAAALARALSAV